MIREFVGFDAYEAACKDDIGFLGWKPAATARWFGISTRDVLRAVQDGVLDLCRVVRLDGSVQLLIPLYSIQSFRWPYEVVSWRLSKKRRPSSWQLLMLQADKERGALHFGITVT